MSVAATGTVLSHAANPKIHCNKNLILSLKIESERDRLMLSKVKPCSFFYFVNSKVHYRSFVILKCLIYFCNILRALHLSFDGNFCKLSTGCDPHFHNMIMIIVAILLLLQLYYAMLLMRANNVLYLLKECFLDGSIMVRPSHDMKFIAQRKRQDGVEYVGIFSFVVSRGVRRILWQYWEKHMHFVFCGVRCYMNMLAGHFCWEGVPNNPLTKTPINAFTLYLKRSDKESVLAL